MKKRFIYLVLTIVFILTEIFCFFIGGWKFVFGIFISTIILFLSLLTIILITKK
jgi:hypothetical protein